MKRVASESRLPGMTSHRHCACGAVLTADDSEQCADCRPALSHAAEQAAEQRRQAVRDLEEAERAIEGAMALLRRIKRKLEIRDEMDRNK